jgi:hypothetical protein
VDEAIAVTVGLSTNTDLPWDVGPLYYPHTLVTDAVHDEADWYMSLRFVFFSLHPFCGPFLVYANTIKRHGDYSGCEGPYYVSVYHIEHVFLLLLLIFLFMK